MIVENDRNQAVVISTLGTEVTVPPCAVRQFIGGVNDFNQDVQVRVKDQSGQVVYRTAVKPATIMSMQVPAGEAGACPTPADTYVLLVANQSSTEVQIWAAGQLVGSVAGRSEQRFGPLPGTWRDAERLIIRNSEGQEMPLKYPGLSLQYELGQVPEIVTSVDDYTYWPKK